MPLSEFDLIQRYFNQPQDIALPEIVKGIGDDAALIQLNAKKMLAVTVDTLLAGVHFPANTDAADIAYKALAVNLSDLAAMGAEPKFFTLALTLPEVNADWLKKFSQGLFELAQEYNVALIGGDTTRGPVLSISIQAIGYVAVGKALMRSNAKVGDDIYVTGYLGEAALGLAIIQNKLTVEPATQQRWLQRLNRPSPRVAVGQALVGIAHAAIDISDGLLADLGHIVQQSQVGAEIWLDKIPLPSVTAIARTALLELALTAGDDYELCFTVSSDKAALLETVLSTLNIHYTKIGRIVAGAKVNCLDQHGHCIHFSTQGYQHFS